MNNNKLELKQELSQAWKALLKANLQHRFEEAAKLELKMIHLELAMRKWV